MIPVDTRVKTVSYSISVPGENVHLSVLVGQLSYHFVDVGAKIYSKSLLVALKLTNTCFLLLVTIAKETTPDFTLISFSVETLGSKAMISVLWTY